VNISANLRFAELVIIANMRFPYLITAIVGFFAAASGAVARPAIIVPEVEEEGDSTLAVIAWFDKRDTVTYWIDEGRWNVNGADTVKTSGVSTKVMLTVTDSTRRGYRMEYKFLDFRCDTVSEPVLGNFQRNVVSLLSDRLKGVSIRFRTDEFGRIKKYENLREIKKLSKGLYRSVLEEMMALPVVDSFKSAGMDLGAVFGDVSDDGALVEGFTEELELMFSNHGNMFTIGDFHNHSDDTEDEYETDTELHIGLDPESMEYEISSRVNSVIPSADLKELLSSVYDIFVGESKIPDFDAEYDSQVTEDAHIENYSYWSYFADGWPQEYVSQTVIKLMDRQQLKQKHIVWDSYSVGNH